MRTRSWNYGNAAAYFITICVHDRLPVFGQVVNSKMKLNDFGLWVDQSWLQTASIRPDMNIHLIEHIVMPDHFHALLVIGYNRFNFDRPESLHAISHELRKSIEKEDSEEWNFENEAVNMGLSHPNNAHMPMADSVAQKFEKQCNNLGSVVRGFKSSVTSEARKRSFCEFRWQSGYYDRIIRNSQDFIDTQFYIRNNPKRWSDRNR